MGKTAKLRHRLIINIESLEKQISQCASDINRPFSILISVVLFPAILALLFLDPRSPLHPIYRAYDNNQFQECNQFTEEFLSEQNERSEGLDQIFQDITNTLETARLGIQTSLQQATSIDDVLKFMDDNPDGDIDIKISNDFKTILIEVIRTYIKLLGKEMPVDLSKFKFKALYYLIITIRQDFKKHSPELLAFGEKFLTDLCIKANFYQLNIVPQVLLTFLAQRFIVDRTLRRLFPNGLGFYARNLKPITIPHNLAILSLTKLKALNERLQTQHNVLMPKAKRNLLFTRALLPILFGLCLAYSGSEVSSRLWIMLICTLGAAMSGVGYEAKEYYEHAIYQRKSDQSLVLANNLFENFAKDVVLIDHGTLETSQIEIEFKNYNGIFPKQIRQNVINVLISHGVQVNQSTQKYIVLPATLQLTRDQVKKIREDINAALIQHKEVTKLQQNLTEQSLISIITLASPGKGFLKTLEYDESAPKKHSEKKGKGKKSSSSSPESAERSEKTEAPSISIKWKSGAYPSDDRITIIENTKYFRHPHFTLFLLSQDDFESFELYDKMRKLVCESPKIVGPKGEQGLVDVSHYVKSDKKWILRSLKTKPMAQHGAYRAIAHAEVAPTGETLHIFDRFKKAH